MNRHIFLPVLLVLALFGDLALGVTTALAEGNTRRAGPLEIIQKNTDRALEILRDPELQGKEHEEERRGKVREAVKGVFDWPEIGKRALGRHWWDRSREEKKEFINLFQKLLERTYLKRIEENADAEISYQGEEIEEDYASVNLLAVARDNTEVPILYRLHKLSEEQKKEMNVPHDWLIYDVKVEGVSLVNNYRSQFNDIIIGSGYDKLMVKLRKKVED